MAKRLAQLLLVPFILLAWPQVNAGKYPYPELINQIADDTRDILSKHGMPIVPDRESLWFKHSAIPGSYILFLPRR